MAPLQQAGGAGTASAELDTWFETPPHPSQVPAARKSHVKAHNFNCLNCTLYELCYQATMQHDLRQLRTAGPVHARPTFRRGQRLRCRDAKQQPPPTYIEDARMQALFEWARQQGIQLGSIRPAAFQGLRGLAAAASIKADDIVLSVPRSLAITLAPKQRCPCPDYVSAEWWAGTPWFAKMAAMLLHQQQLRGQSQLQPYLDSLPTAVNSPVSWSQKQLQQLQYPHLIHQVGRGGELRGQHVHASRRGTFVSAFGNTCSEHSLMFNLARQQPFPSAGVLNGHPPACLGPTTRGCSRAATRIPSPPTALSPAQHPAPLAPTKPRWWTSSASGTSYTSASQLRCSPLQRL